MSTRCQIAFYRTDAKSLMDYEALIYRHSDGYPEGVLPDILPFLKWFDSQRGMGDIKYCSARLLQYLCNKYDKSMEQWEKCGEFTGLLGHGICNGFHGDIEYLYAIYPKLIKVYEVEFDMKGCDIISRSSLKQTIDFTKHSIKEVLEELTSTR